MTIACPGANGVIVLLQLGLRSFNSRQGCFIGGNAHLQRCACCAGYEEQKQEIEDTLLLALQHPDVYEAIAAGTRRRPGSNRPRAVLFEGPPGCGKTTSARSAFLMSDPVLCQHHRMPERSSGCQPE